VASRIGKNLVRLSRHNEVEDFGAWRESQQQHRWRVTNFAVRVMSVESQLRIWHECNLCSWLLLGHPPNVCLDGSNSAFDLFLSFCLSRGSKYLPHAHLLGPLKAVLVIEVRASIRMQNLSKTKAFAVSTQGYDSHVASGRGGRIDLQPSC